MSEYIRTNEFDTNECPNIFIKEKLIQMNVRINICDQYIQIQLLESPIPPLSQKNVTKKCHKKTVPFGYENNGVQNRDRRSTGTERVTVTILITFN